MVTRVLAGVLISVVILTGTSAQAGEERKCSKQYSLEQHLILEWAALGGDPHAQFAIAQCAFPLGTKKLSEPEKTYALKWITLASCDVLDDEETLKRNVRTRQLKNTGNLSFRRFGGETKKEGKLTTREKMFRDYRLNKIDELKQRNAEISALVSDEDHQKANDALIVQFSGMGELGLLRLGQLTSCGYFEATEEFKAASWAAAEEVWERSDLSEVTGKSEKRGWSISKESDNRLAALNTAERRTAAYEKMRLLKNRPARVAELENQAALANLQNLSTAHLHASERGIPSNTVTLAIQYALEALGLIEFMTGPDNDYGPTTIEAVQKLQASSGADETRWLSHEQVRNTICKAAIEKADPISMFHVALMHANGWGFKQNYNKAHYAIDRAEKAMKIRLDAVEELAKWKQVDYPRFIAEIEAEKLLIDASWEALPAREKPPLSNDMSFCN